MKSKKKKRDWKREKEDEEREEEEEEEQMEQEEKEEEEEVKKMETRIALIPTNWNFAKEKEKLNRSSGAFFRGVNPFALLLSFSFCVY